MIIQVKNFLLCLFPLPFIQCNMLEIAIWGSVFVQGGVPGFTYVRTYVHTYVRTYVRTYVCTYVCTYVRFPGFVLRSVTLFPVDPLGVVKFGSSLVSVKF